MKLASFGGLLSSHSQACTFSGEGGGGGGIRLEVLLADKIIATPH